MTLRGVLIRSPSPGREKADKVLEIWGRRAMSKGRTEVDVLIIGAGFAGLYALYKIRRMGLEALALEAAASVGGTWYANRYPGARVDIQSLDYSFSFSEELQQEWRWTERYASQPQLLCYANHVADRFGLRDGVRLNTRVTRAHFDEAAQRWRVGADDGRIWTARFVIMATGPLSAPHKHAGVRGPRDFCRRGAALRPMAARAGRFHRPPGGGGRHGNVGGADHPDDRAADEIADRVPADGRLCRAVAQRPA
jgi:glycine/D-amino acid oxidase-like deaminating enzyme